jgi:capsular polysaccharide export protein
LKRSFLFLQGVCSPFFGKLADRLVQDGHRVAKINFNAGDAAYWGFRPAMNFRGPAEEIGEFIAAAYERHGITDQILFGDCRPIHAPVVVQANPHGIRTHVFEEGYFRPHWITLERGGVNAHSPLPRDPDWYRRVGPNLPEYHQGTSFHSPFWVRAGHDVAYHVAGIANPVLFPRYRTHAPVNAAVEYASYLSRMHRVRQLEKRDTATVSTLSEGNVPYYLLPLQLGSDAQIRFHSPFNDMSEVIDSVMASFAQHAPAGSRFVIKNHPLDIGLEDYGRTSAMLAERHGIADRIDYLESGDLAVLVHHARGTVTVNSTVGSVALAAECPTITLSNPIYNLAGLTFQHGLDRFWTESVRPDAELFRLFRNTVVHAAQINGGFYCKAGIALAVANSVVPLTADTSPLEALS